VRGRLPCARPVPPTEELALSPRHLAAGTESPRRRTGAALLPEAVRDRAPLVLFLLAGVLCAAALLMIAVAPTPTGGTSARDASHAGADVPGHDLGDDAGEGIGSAARRTPPAPAPAATQAPLQADRAPAAGDPAGLGGVVLAGDQQVAGAPGDSAVGGSGGGTPTGGQGSGGTAAGQAAGAVGGTTGGKTGASSGGRGGSSGGSGGSSGGGSAPQQPAPAPAPPPPTCGCDTVEETTDGVGGVVGEVTEGAGGLVGGLLP
jgi:hypothetical protein